MTSEGQIFKTKEAVLEYSQKTGDLLVYDTLRKIFDDGESWNYCEDLPSGWSIKKFGVSNMFKSPSGEKMNGKRCVLKFMIKNNYPSDQIQQTRHSLISENWQTNSDLPNNWLLKKDKEGKRRYVSSSGELFKSKDKALRYLKEHGSLSDYSLLQKI